MNVVCKRINSILSGQKQILLEICETLDRQNTDRLTYEQFRLSTDINLIDFCYFLKMIFYVNIVLKDRLPQLSREDLFVLTKLFEIEGLIDYRAILDETIGTGILQHVTELVVPPSKQIILEKKPPKELKRSFNEPLQLNHPR